MTGQHVVGKTPYGAVVGDVQNLAPNLGLGMGKAVRRSPYPAGVAAGEIDDIGTSEPVRQAFGEGQAQPLGGTGDDSDLAHERHAANHRGTD